MRFALALIATLALVGTATAAFTARTQNPASSLATASAFECDYPGLVLGTGGLSSYWRLGETSGTTATDDGGSVDGTYSGSHTKGVADPIAGIADPAVQFAGGSVDIGDYYDFAGTASFSLEAWIRPTTIDAVWRRIVSKNRTEGAGRQGYELWVQAPNGIGFERFRDGTIDAATTAAPPLDAWTHVVATYDGSTMRLYVDGALADSTPSSQSMLDNGATLRIGNSSPGGDPWAGDLDDVSIYTGALSPAQVQSRFQCGRRYRDVVLETPGLQSYWRLGEASGVTAFDSEGTANGAHGNGPTLGGTGAPTYANGATIFDGINDHIGFGDVYDFAGTASFTVEGWFNRTSAGEGGWRIIAAKEPASDPRDGWAIAISPGSQLVYFDRVIASSDNVVVSTTATVAGTWYHFAATYDGATMRIYMNGVLEASAPSTLSIPNTSYSLRLGAMDPAPSNRFAGRLDEIAIYDTELSAAQIAEHYRSR